MNIEVHNVTYTSATISWSTSRRCAPNYYNVMYRPNWKRSLFSSQARQSYHREKPVPHSQNSLVLKRLTPSVTYILCVTCKNSYPSSDHCMMFHTLDKGPVSHKDRPEADNTKLTTSTVLLLGFAAIFLYGCFQYWCCKRCFRPLFYRLAQQEEEEKEMGRWTD
uniref:Fibronectin type III domain containing 9 n=1 Tax=Latimeria chalumnae TaxID=7897 RepID=H3B4Q1_LATCH